MKSSLQFHRLLCRFFIVTFVAVFVAFSTVQADRKPRSDRCNPEYTPGKTFLTIYGDSLGDLVDFPAYGWLDWESYFGMHHPEVAWDVQNLAAGGWTTADVYKLIRDCAQSAQQRSNFKTAKNVAFEIGGNDYLWNLPWLVYLPWMYPRVQENVLYN